MQYEAARQPQYLKIRSTGVIPHQINKFLAIFAMTTSDLF